MASEAPRLYRSYLYRVFVMIGWLLFVSEGETAGIPYLVSMFSSAAGFISHHDVYELARNAIFAFLAVIGATPIPKKLYISLFTKKSRTVSTVTAFVSLGLFILCVSFLASSSFNPFLYWNF